MSSPLPVGGGKRKVKGGAFIPRYSTVDLAATPQSAQQPIQANSQIVEAVDTTHHLSCAGYRQRVGSLIEFELKSTARTPILYQISDILHDTTARGVHICAGLPYTFKTFGKPARLATLPDGTMGYIGLLPACERDATGKITSTGPCVSRVRQVPALRNRNVLNTIVHLQVPAISQVDPWMGG